MSYYIVHRILEIGIVFYRCGTFRLFLSLEADNSGLLLSSDRIVGYVRRFCRSFLMCVIFYWWGFRFFCLLGDNFWLLFQIIQKKSDGLLWAYWSDRFFFLNGQKVRNSLVMRVVFSALKARGVVFVCLKAPMHYCIEAYILSFITYKYHIAANQDWTGDLIFRMGQATKHIISWLVLLLTKFNDRIITVWIYFASQFFRKLKKELLSSKNLHMFPLHQIHWYMSIDLCCRYIRMPQEFLNNSDINVGF